jgi:hypothetical protein
LIQFSMETAVLVDMEQIDRAIPNQMVSAKFRLLGLSIL